MLDHVNELNTDTPKIRAVHGTVPADLILNAGATVAQPSAASRLMLLDPAAPAPDHHAADVDVVQVFATTSPVLRDEAILRSYLAGLPAQDVFRVKGFVELDGDAGILLVNHAFGRPNSAPVATRPAALHDGLRLALVFMGHDLRLHLPRLVGPLGIPPSEAKCHFRAAYA